MTEAFEAFHKGTTDSVCVDVVEVVGAELPIFLLAFQQIIGDYQQWMCDRKDGTLGSASRCHSSVECRPVILLLRGGGPTGLG